MSGILRKTWEVLNRDVTDVKLDDLIDTAKIWAGPLLIAGGIALASLSPNYSSAQESKPSTNWCTPCKTSASAQTKKPVRHYHKPKPRPKAANVPEVPKTPQCIEAYSPDPAVAEFQTALKLDGSASVTYQPCTDQNCAERITGISAPIALGDIYTAIYSSLPENSRVRADRDLFSRFVRYSASQNSKRADVFVKWNDERVIVTDASGNPITGTFVCIPELDLERLVEPKPASVVVPPVVAPQPPKAALEGSTVSGKGNTVSEKSKSGPRANGWNAGGMVNYSQIARVAETETIGPSGEKETNKETINDTQTNAGVMVSYLFGNGLGFYGKVKYDQFSGQQRGQGSSGSAGLAVGGPNWMAAIGYGLMDETVKISDKDISVERDRKAKGVDISAIFDKAYGNGKSRVGGAVKIFTGNGDSKYTIKIPDLDDISKSGSLALTEVEATVYWLPLATENFATGPQVSVQNLNRHEESGGYAQTNIAPGWRFNWPRVYADLSYVTSTESTTGAKSNGTGWMIRVGAYNKMPTP